MNKLSKPKEIYRTTFDQIFETTIPTIGIYVIAYMGRVLYVGKAETCVFDRLMDHMNKDLIGIWLKRTEFDWSNVRLDILVPPSWDDHRWIMQAEEACIRRFSPLFNDQLMIELPSIFKDASQLMFAETGITP